MPLPVPPFTMLRNAALFLDFDGTLVRIADEPGAIVVEPELRDLLQRLRDRLGGRVTLVSGRSSADVQDWLAPLDVAVIGSHGLERAGGTTRPASGLVQSLDRLRAVETQHPGVLVEEKPFGAAIHYRNAPDAEETCREAACDAATRAGMEVQPGKMVFEIKPAGINKGTAIRALMDEPPNAGSRPVFLGDDLTDEHGFAVARELGGDAILVGEERETAATYRLRDVAHVRSWLNDACEALS